MSKFKYAAFAGALIACSYGAAFASQGSDIAGKLCAIKLTSAARSSTPATLLAQSKHWVNYKHLLATVARLNGDSLANAKMASAYNEGLTDYAKHMLPQLATQLKQTHVTGVTSSGNTFAIGYSTGATVIVDRGCHVLDAKYGIATLTGEIAKHIKANFT